MLYVDTTAYVVQDLGNYVVIVEYIVPLGSKCRN